MSESTMENADGDWREASEGALERFLIVAMAAFVVMAAGVFIYGFYGDRITAGLDAACSEAAFNAGQGLAAAGNSERAIQKFRQAMEGRFTDPEQRYMCGRAIGDLLVQERRYAEAIDAYGRLPKEAFTAAGALTGFVTALYRDGRVEEAGRLGEEWLAKAKAARQKDPARENAQLVVWANDILMRVAEDQGRNDDALAYGAAAIAAGRDAIPDGEASQAHLVMARILANLGEVAEAREHIETFLSNTTNTLLFAEGTTMLEALDNNQPIPPRPISASGGAAPEAGT